MSRSGFDSIKTKSFSENSCLPISINFRASIYVCPLSTSKTGGSLNQPNLKSLYLQLAAQAFPDQARFGGQRSGNFSEAVFLLAPAEFGNDRVRKSKKGVELGPYRNWLLFFDHGQ
jgi:hypothetical protein